MTIPRIGVTGNTRALGDAERAGVNAAYVRAVTQAGAVPLILSPLIGTAHLEVIVDAIDGLVLTGGEDIHPTHYGEAPHPRLGTVDQVRDAFELALFREATARGLPVLAICRGIQLINVALGGTLWQDLPSQRPDALDHNPRSARDDRTHPVHLLPGSRLARVLGVTACEVNSFHHQTIREPAPGLVVSARAPDGEIEGVESAEGAPWLLAVQWHPEEFHHHLQPVDHGLFAALVAEAGNRAVAFTASAARHPSQSVTDRASPR